MLKRTFLFIVLSCLIWSGVAYYDSYPQPEVQTQLTIDALNGGNNEAGNLRMSQHVNNAVPEVATGLTLFAGLLCYGGTIKRAIVNAGRKERNHA